MSVKKNKRKTVKHHHEVKKQSISPSLISRHPRVCFLLGCLLLTVGTLLLSIGYVSNAKVGLSMLSLFFGVCLVLLANATSTRSSK